MVGVSHSSEAKIADFEVARRVQQQVRRLEVPVEHIGWMNVLEASEDLVEEVANVIIAQTLKRQV